MKGDEVTLLGQAVSHTDHLANVVRYMHKMKVLLKIGTDTSLCEAEQWLVHDYLCLLDEAREEMRAQLELFMACD